jgi:predicted ATP-dependent endonuclease of OLD family
VLASSSAAVPASQLGGFRDKAVLRHRAAAGMHGSAVVSVSRMMRVTHMQIQNLRIANYRGIGAEQTLEFACPSGFNASGLTVFVGPNNAGKSTVLRALDGIYSDDSQFVAETEDRRGGLFPAMTSSFSFNGQNGTVSIRQNGSSAYIGKEDRLPGRHCVYMPARRPWRDRFSRQESYSWAAFESNAVINRKNDEHYVDNQFGNALHSLERDLQLKSIFLTLLQYIEPTITDFWVDRGQGQDFLAFRSVSGFGHRAGIVGEGVQNIFRLCHALLSLEAHQVLLLDEPELSLHPQSQRRLYQLLAKRAADRQVIVSTHSVHFIDWSHIRAGTKIYRANLLDQAGSTFHQLSSCTIQTITRIADADAKNRRAFDALAKEVFFTRGCVLVEGYEDAHLLQGFFKEVGFSEIEIFGYGAGGADGIVAWLKACSDLGIRAVAIFDGDTKGGAALERARAAFGETDSIKLLQIPERDIRDKHRRTPDCRRETDEIEVEGVFTRDWQLKEEHKGYMTRLAADIGTFLNADIKAPDFA